VFQQAYSNFKKEDLKSYFLKNLKENEIEYFINGQGSTLPHILSLSLPNTNAGVLVRENEDALCLAQGSACSSKEIEASHVLTALGLSREQAEYTFRISFTHEITCKDIDFLVQAIKKAAI